MEFRITHSLKKLSILFSGLVLLLVLSPLSPCWAATLWVSTAGSDDSAGTEQAPMATIGAALARDAAAKILVMPGTYQIEKAIELGAKNAGASIEATDSGQVVISGGAQISGFEPAGAGMWRAKAEMSVVRLWVNGKPAHSAQIPDNYWHYTRDVRPASHDERAKLSRRAFHPDPEDMAILAKLSPEELAGVVVTNWQSWGIAKNRIASIDAASNTIYLARDIKLAFFNFANFRRYHLENVPGPLRVDGTWYKSPDNWLYYRPHPGEDMRTAKVFTSTLPQLLKINDTQNITFKGVRFEYGGAGDPTDQNSGQAAAKVDAALTIDNSKNLMFDNIAIAHTNGYGIWFRSNCHNSTLTHSLIEDLGAGGVRIGQIGDVSSGQETSGIVVENNIIRHGGRLFPDAVGILVVHAADNLISHNEINDFFYSGISVGWQWGYKPSLAIKNIIENNHIHNIGQGRLNDMGGIYTLGVSPGTVIRGNVIHNVLSYPFDTAKAGNGIYTDEGSSEILIENNLVYNVTGGAFHQHYGRDNILRNNVLSTLNGSCNLSLTRSEKHLSVTVSGNAVLSDGVPFLCGNWRQAQVKLEKNIYFDISGKPVLWSGMSLSSWQSAGFDKGSAFFNPGFVDFKKGNFRLQKNAKWSWPSGISPLDSAGVYGSPEWKKIAADVNGAEPIGSIPSPPAL